MKLDISKAVIDKGVGYYYVYSPMHPMSNAAGKVYIHRYIAEQYYGIKLDSTLHVHHKDNNKLNNEPDNLEILTASEHRKLHSSGSSYETLCNHCGNMFITYASSDAQYCSKLCYDLSTRKFEITKESLQELVKCMPITHIAKLLGVSDVAVHKRCKLLNIQKMPRGYFLRK